MKYPKAQYIIGNQVAFLQFMRTRTPMYHLSNIFLRDLHFAIIEFLRLKGIHIRNTEAEQIAKEVAGNFEKKNLLKKVNTQTWTLLYPDFAAKKAG